MSGIIKRGDGGSSAEQSIRERIRSRIGGTYETANDVCLLLDRTGSMWGDPIRELRKVIRDFNGVRRFEYADDIRELKPDEEVSDACGNNNEPLAFKTLKSLGIKHVIMVTDGHPDHEDASLRAAEGLKIDVIYIGPPPEPEFLRKLAAKTGGTYGRCKLDIPLQLNARIRALLPAAKGPIAL